MVGDDGRVAVVRVFDLVDGHFWFDYARVGAGAAAGQQLAEDSIGGRAAGVGQGVRGMTLNSNVRRA